MLKFRATYAHVASVVLTLTYRVFVCRHQFRTLNLTSEQIASPIDDSTEGGLFDFGNFSP